MWARFAVPWATNRRRHGSTPRVYYRRAEALRQDERVAFVMGVKFDEFDVEAEPGAASVISTLRIPRVPATIVGDRRGPRLESQGLAELVRGPLRERKQLAPAELSRRPTSCSPPPRGPSVRCPEQLA